MRMTTVITAAKLSRQNRQFIERRAADAGTNLSRALESIVEETRLREEFKAEQAREETK